MQRVLDIKRQRNDLVAGVVQFHLRVLCTSYLAYMRVLAQIVASQRFLEKNSMRHHRHVRKIPMTEADYTKHAPEREGALKIIWNIFEGIFFCSIWTKR